MKPLIALLLMLAQVKINPDSAIIQTFEQRVADYVKMRKAALDGMPSPARTMKHGELLREQHEIADRIRNARPDARQGDICSPEIAGELRRLIGLALSAGDETRIEKTIRRSDAVPVQMKINGPFPDRLPQPSMPPTLLLNLPSLPPDLDYRLVGRSLVLRDTLAGIIVDFVPGALPFPATKPGAK